MDVAVGPDDAAWVFVLLLGPCDPPSDVAACVGVCAGPSTLKGVGSTHACCSPSYAPRMWSGLTAAAPAVPPSGGDDDDDDDADDDEEEEEKVEADPICICVQAARTVRGLGPVAVAVAGSTPKRARSAWRPRCHTCKKGRTLVGLSTLSTPLRTDLKIARAHAPEGQPCHGAHGLHCDASQVGGDDTLELALQAWVPGAVEPVLFAKRYNTRQLSLDIIYAHAANAA